MNQRSERPRGLHVELDDTALHVRCTGVTKLLCMGPGLSIPRSSVASATVMTQASAKADLGWRTMGGYLPGRFATGWYKIRGRDGVRQWWAVFRDPEVLVVDTTLDKPARVVVQCPDRAEIARALNEASAAEG